MAELEIPHAEFPGPGDKLFVESPWGAFTENHGEANRSYHLLQGYKEAADALVELAGVNWHLGRRYVNPIVFLYRHHVELQLKFLIFKYGSVVGIKPDRSNHNIEHLWSNCLNIIKGMNADGDPEALAAVGEILNEFSLADKRSMAFRYAADKDGKAFPVPSAVDLANLKAVMDKLHLYFDCLWSLLDEN